MNSPLAFDLSFNPVQVVILGAIAVLLFGKRLPEVGRSLGKGIAEFRKGLRGIEDAFRDATSSATSSYDYQYQPSTHDVDDHDEPTAPKFEPPPQPKKESAELGATENHQTNLEEAEQPTSTVADMS